MNFQELVNRMTELDQPKVESSDLPVEECGLEEMPMPPMSMPPMSMPPKDEQQDTVNMNVSINAAGSGGIKDLMDILRNIESKGLDSHDHDHDHNDKEMPLIDLGLEDAPREDYANEPDEMYNGVDSVIQTGSDLHSKGAEAPAQAGGGNPWNIKESLQRLYDDIKTR